MRGSNINSNVLSGIYRPIITEDERPPIRAGKRKQRDEAGYSPENFSDTNTLSNREEPRRIFPSLNDLATVTEITSFVNPVFHLACGKNFSKSKIDTLFQQAWDRNRNEYINCPGCNKAITRKDFKPNKLLKIAIDVIKSRNSIENFQSNDQVIQNIDTFNIDTNIENYKKYIKNLEKFYILCKLNTKQESDILIKISRFYYLLGDIYLKKPDDKKAKKAFKRAIELKNSALRLIADTKVDLLIDIATIHEKLGKIYQKQTNNKKMLLEYYLALILFHNAFKDPNCTEFQKTQINLKIFYTRKSFAKFIYNSNNFVSKLFTIKNYNEAINLIYPLLQGNLEHEKKFQLVKDSINIFANLVEIYKTKPENIPDVLQSYLKIVKLIDYALEKNLCNKAFEKVDLLTIKSQYCNAIGNWYNSNNSSYLSLTYYMRAQTFLKSIFENFNLEDIDQKNTILREQELNRFHLQSISTKLGYI